MITKAFRIKHDYRRRSHQYTYLLPYLLLKLKKTKFQEENIISQSFLLKLFKREKNEFLPHRLDNLYRQ